MISLVPAVLLVLADGAPASGRAEAERLVQEGVARRYEGREEEAYALFARADALAPSPRAKAQMALAAKSLRRFVEAERLLETALAAAGDAWIADNRATLEQALALVQRQLAWVAIAGAPSGAELSVNGRSHGRFAAADRVRVPAGELVVEVRAPGYQARREALTVAAGTTRAIAVTLARAPPPPPPTAPAAAPESALGRWRTAALVAGAAGLAGIAAGSYFGLRALGLRAERDAKCPDEICSTAEGVELDREGRRMGVLSTVCFGVGAAGAVTAAALVLAGRAGRPAPPRAARLGLAAAPGGLVLSLSGPLAP